MDFKILTTSIEKIHFKPLNSLPYPDNGQKVYPQRIKQWLPCKSRWRLISQMRLVSKLRQLATWLGTDKLKKIASFSVCSTAMLGIVPGYEATCTVDPYNTTRLPILQFWANWVKVVTFLCACGHAHSHSAWGENIANIWLPYTNIWENFEVPQL